MEVRGRQPSPYESWGVGFATPKLLGQRDAVDAGFSEASDGGFDVRAADGVDPDIVLSSHRPSEPMLRPMLLTLYRCSLATSQTMSQISRSL